MYFLPSVRNVNYDLTRCEPPTPWWDVVKILRALNTAHGYSNASATARGDPEKNYSSPRGFLESSFSSTWHEVTVRFRKSSNTNFRRSQLTRQLRCRSKLHVYNVGAEFPGIVMSSTIEPRLSALITDRGSCISLEAFRRLETGAIRLQHTRNKRDNIKFHSEKPTINNGSSIS